jgi:hypothetical protein
MTWVVWQVETGYSDESMRFGTRAEAVRYMAAKCAPWHFDIREEAE